MTTQPLVGIREFQRSFGNPAARGDLPDGRVLGATSDDLPALIDLIHSLDWPIRLEGHARLPAANKLDDLMTAQGARLVVLPRSDLRIHFFNWGQLDFDFDLRQVTDQNAVDLLCTLMSGLYHKFDRAVVVIDEGGPDDDPVLRYDRDGLFVRGAAGGNVRPR